MSGIWVLVVLVATTTAIIKGVGPFALGARPLPPPVLRVIGLLASALLAALVVTNALADGRHLAVGASTVGVAVAGGLLLTRRVPLLVVVLVAAGVTAGLRLLT